jgi:ribosome-binding factor A
MSRMHKIEDLLHKEIASIIISKIDNQDVKNTVTITDIKLAKTFEVLLYILLH